MSSLWNSVCCLFTVMVKLSPRCRAEVTIWTVVQPSDAARGSPGVAAIGFAIPRIVLEAVSHVGGGDRLADPREKWGDHQFREEPVEPAHAEERLPDHQNRPLVADRCQRKRHRARATTLKLRWVGRAARALHCRHGRSPRSGPVT